MEDNIVLNYWDIKQTWIIDEQTEIYLEELERIATIIREHMGASDAYFLSTPFRFNPHDGQRWMMAGWCMPSREGLHTGINREEAEGLWIDAPDPVEEDSVFAPREVEVKCGLDV